MVDEAKVGRMELSNFPALLDFLDSKDWLEYTELERRKGLEVANS
jgi:hypothetical protein